MKIHETKQYTFLDNQGTFRLEQPENVSYLYFPIAGEQGIKGAVTPAFGGDLKRNQNEFILQPVSAEELHNNKSTRNFWCYLGENACFSVTGVSAKAQAEKFTDRQDKSMFPMRPRIKCLTILCTGSVSSPCSEGYTAVRSSPTMITERAGADGVICGRTVLPC